MIVLFFKMSSERVHIIFYGYIFEIKNLSIILVNFISELKNFHQDQC